MTKTPSCIATLSGGIDSTVMVHQLVADGETPLCVYVDYGTVCRDAELRAARETCKDLDLELRVLPFPIYKDIAKALILGNSTEATKGSMFWLEGRNAVIGLLLAVMASGMGLTEVYVGINYGDSGGDYKDTDIKFITTLNLLIMTAMRGEVTVVAPWINNKMYKSDVIEQGNGMSIDWIRTTHSCSSSNTTPCLNYEVCESCLYRKHDFEEAGLRDPFMVHVEQANGHKEEKA